MPDLSQYTGTWTIDPTHTRLGFTARHAMVTKVRGAFTEFEGTLTLDGAAFTLGVLVLATRKRRLLRRQLLGIPIGIGVIVFTVLITGFYVRRANSEYDRLTAEILKDANP